MFIINILNCKGGPINDIQNVNVVWKIGDINSCETTTTDKIAECRDKFVKLLFEYLKKNCIKYPINLLSSGFISDIRSLILLNTLVVKNIELHDKNNNELIKPFLTNFPKSNLDLINLSDSTKTIKNNNKLLLQDDKIFSNNLEQLNKSTNINILLKHTEEILLSELIKKYNLREIYFFIGTYDVTQKLIEAIVNYIINLISENDGNYVPIHVKTTNVVNPITILFNKKKYLFKQVNYKKNNFITTFDSIDPLTHLVLWITSQTNINTDYLEQIYNNKPNNNKIPTIILELKNKEYIIGTLCLPIIIYNKNKKLFQEIEKYFNITINNTKNSYITQESYKQSFGFFILIEFMNSITEIIDKIVINPHFNVTKKDLTHHAFDIFNFFSLLFFCKI